MAGDWVKWCKGLAKRREVVVVASRLKRDRRDIAGRLMELWEWADENFTEDDIAGDSDDVSLFVGDKPFEFIDELLGLPGMAEVLASPEVRWLTVRSEGRITFPNLARHNGKSAKERALDQRKKKRLRNQSPGCPDSNGTTSGPEREKRREENTKKPRKPLKAHKPVSRSGSVRDLDSVEENEGKARQAISKIQTKHLRDTGLLVRFHEALARLDVWGMNKSESSLLRLLGTAERAMRGENPGGLFNTLVQGGCKVLDPDDEDAASRRWREYQSTQGCEA